MWCPCASRYDVPLVADIHFQPAVALMVADAFEKIRVNPGNFADGRKTFEVINYDDPAQFRAEQEHIAEVGGAVTGAGVLRGFLIIITPQGAASAAMSHPEDCVTAACKCASDTTNVWFPTHATGLSFACIVGRAKVLSG